MIDGEVFLGEFSSHGQSEKKKKPRIYVELGNYCMCYNTMHMHVIVPCHHGDHFSGEFRDVFDFLFSFTTVVTRSSRCLAMPGIKDFSQVLKLQHSPAVLRIFTVVDHLPQTNITKAAV